MWTRGFLKSRAKDVLRISYWKAFLISIVIAIVGGNSGGGSFNFNWNFGNNGSNNYSNQLFGTMVPFLVAMLVGAAFLVLIFALAFRIFIGYPLEVGGRRYFVQAARSDIEMNYLGYAFEKGKYLNVIKTMLWRGVLNFLWYLLLIIPGIIKSYAYRMVPYILAENPNIGYKRAVDLSKKMTDGQKFDMFVLDLSFIGWYLLGTLALLIGVLFVMPYENATKAELYLVLRQNALDNGLCSPEELMMNPVLQVDGI